MNEIDPQKLEILRQALPRGLAAGDSGLVESRGTPDAMPQWTPFRSNTTQQKLRNPAPEFSDPPQVASASLAPEEIFHPWKITIVDTSTTSTPVWRYKIEQASRLFNGFGGNEITVNGADGVLRNIGEGYYILEIDISNGIVTQAQIKINSSFGNAIETSGTPPKQTKARIRIGYVYTEGSGSSLVYRIRQNAFHNFTLIDACRNGAPIKYPIAT